MVEDFHIVVQTSQSGFSDLYQIVYVLVGESSKQTLDETSPVEHPEGFSVNLNFWQEVGTLMKPPPGNSSSLPPKPVDQNEFSLGTPKSG